MLIVEDGTGKVDSQTYATVTELEVYALGRNISLPSTVAEKELLLVKAMGFLEGLDYIGDRATLEQSLEWPRIGVVLHKFWLDPGVIPPALKRGQMQLALDSMAVDLTPTVTPSTVGQVIEETVEGAVSVKYAAPAAVAPSSGGPWSTATGGHLSLARTLLRPIVRSTTQLRVGRG